MTKNERLIIKHELELTYRCVLRQYYIDKNSEEYTKHTSRLVQTEHLAKALCPKNTTIADYFWWNDETKAKNRAIINRWREEE